MKKVLKGIQRCIKVCKGIKKNNDIIDLGIGMQKMYQCQIK